VDWLKYSSHELRTKIASISNASAKYFISQVLYANCSSVSTTRAASLFLFLIYRAQILIEGTHQMVGVPFIRPMVRQMPSTFGHRRRHRRPTSARGNCAPLLRPAAKERLTPSAHVRRTGSAGFGCTGIGPPSSELRR